MTYIKLPKKPQKPYGGIAMLRTIAVRGKKDIVAVFSKYAQISGEQDTSRPKATADFIEYISKMPLDENTVIKLRQASKQHIDESEIADKSIPSFIKIPINVEDETWGKAMEVFRYAFSLKGNPQMPYFLRVAGTAYIHDLKEQEANLSICAKKAIDNKERDIPFSLEKFKSLTIDNKLNEIYKILLERGV